MEAHRNMECTLPTLPVSTADVSWTHTHHPVMQVFLKKCLPKTAVGLSVKTNETNGCISICLSASYVNIKMKNQKKISLGDVTTIKLFPTCCHDK